MELGLISGSCKIIDDLKLENSGLVLFIPFQK
jgi:hypothetical protein